MNTKFGEYKVNVPMHNLETRKAYKYMEWKVEIDEIKEFAIQFGNKARDEALLFVVKKMLEIEN